MRTTRGLKLPPVHDFPNKMLSLDERLNPILTFIILSREVVESVVAGVCYSFNEKGRHFYHKVIEQIMLFFSVTIEMRHFLSQ